MIADIIKSELYDKVESVLDGIDHIVTATNVSGDKWQITLSFDLDSIEMNAAEKTLITQILKHL